MTRDEVLKLLETARRILQTASRDAKKGAGAEATLDSVDAAYDLVAKARAELRKELASGADTMFAANEAPSGSR